MNPWLAFGIGVIVGVVLTLAVGIAFINSIHINQQPHIDDKKEG